MLTITRTALRANRRRLLGISAAVAIGIAFLSGTLVLGDTIRAGFDDAFADANAGTDVVVRAEKTVGEDAFTNRPPLSSSVLADIESVDGVAEVAPTLEGSAQIVGADGTAIGGQGPPTIGTNWVASTALNPYSIIEGRAPTTAGEVVIDRGSATTGELAVGDTTTVRAPRPVEVRIVGIAAFGDEDNIGGSTLVAFTEDQARELLLGGADVVSSFGVVADDGVSPADLQRRIASALPDGAEAITGEALSAEQVDALGDEFLNFFTTFLVVFSGIALLVATFSIHNTFTVVLAQRMRESALLRAIGATRAQVLGAIAAEALVIGMVAAAVGVVAGLGLATGLDALFGAIGLDFPGSGLVVELDSLIVSGVVGLLVTLIAAIVPSIRASRVAPLAAMRDVSIDHSASSRVRAVVGAVMTLAAFAAMVAGRSSIALVGGAAVVLVVGVVVVGPVLVAPAMQLLGALPARLRGASAALARGNAARNPRRTASTATALLIGVCIVSLFTAFASSLKESVVETIGGSITSELVIQSGFSGAGLSDRLVPDLSELPQAETAAGLSDTPASVGGEEGFVTVTDPEPLARVTDLDLQAGSLLDMGDGGIAVSAEIAKRKSWSVGDRLEVRFLDGELLEAPVAAIHNRPEIVGNILVPAAMAEPHVVRLTNWLVLISGADGVDVGELRAAVADVADRNGVEEVMDRDGFATDAAGEIDALLVVVYALLALSIVIALVGIGNTLSLSIHERTRELGLLRAVGQTRRQLRSMVRWESVMVSLFGTLAGAALGTFVAWSVVSALVAEEGFGSFSAPIGQIAVIVVVGALVGVIAAVRPARRAARLDVLDAIASE